MKEMTTEYLKKTIFVDYQLVPLMVHHTFWRQLMLTASEVGILWSAKGGQLWCDVESEGRKKTATSRHGRSSQLSAPAASQTSPTDCRQRGGRREDGLHRLGTRSRTGEKHCGNLRRLRHQERHRGDLNYCTNGTHLFLPHWTHLIVQINANPIYCTN